MQASFGINVLEQVKNKRLVHVTYDPTRLINGHMLVIGGSGAGKTTLLRNVLKDMITNCPGYERPGQLTRFHVFDVHEDIDLPDSSEVLFSQATPYGLNPLRVGADPHYGGVWHAIDTFVRVVETTGHLGARQIAALRTILLDVYRLHGFDPESPSSWHVDDSASRLVSDANDDRLYLDVPYEDRAEASQLGARWDPNMKIPRRNGLWYVPVNAYEGAITRWRPMTLGRTHPTLSDVIRFTKRLVMQNFLGSDQVAVSKLEIFQRQVKKMRKEVLLAARDGRNVPDGAPDGDSPLERAKKSALEGYEQYLNAASSGAEIDFLIKYGSTDLKSVLDRLETLAATGVFKNEEPPFDPRRRVHRYLIKPLRNAGRMFVLFKLQELYNAAIERGETDRIVEVAVVDEAHRFVDEKGDDILSTLAREARKFGLVIIASNQDADLPKPFVGSLATKVVLSLDRTLWPSAIAKMGLTADQLRAISPFNKFAVQMKDSSNTTGVWLATGWNWTPG